MVHILLATYNGEQYIEEQLESILNQNDKNWKLHICDDCSSDKTLEIIQRFTKLEPERVFCSVNEKNLGARETFSRLFREVREPGYYAFCDQDDVWDPDKLTIMLRTLREEEKKKKKAILVYSDVRIIDEHGGDKNGSFIRNSGLYPPSAKMLEHLLLYNFIQGSAMMWNYELHALVKMIPEQALMHDWWLALVAAGQGKIIFIDRTLGAYRQHSDNVVGAFDRKKWHDSMVKKSRISNWHRLYQNNQILRKERVLQARAYQKYFQDKRVELFLCIMRDKRRFRRTFRGIHNGYIFLSKKYSIKFYIL